MTKSRTLFSAKHYDFLASVIYAVRVVHHVRRNKLLNYLTDAMADHLSNDNPRFNRRKFLAVCEFGPFEANKIEASKAMTLEALTGLENQPLSQRAKP